jgi:hypothetical protein
MIDLLKAVIASRDVAAYDGLLRRSATVILVCLAGAA